jgi:hypothetical protein
VTAGGGLTKIAIDAEFAGLATDVAVTVTCWFGEHARGAAQAL